MTYQEIIQKVGKQLTKNVYYYVGTERYDLNINDIQEVKLTYNAELVGTLMKGLELKLKSKISTTDAIYLEVVAKYGDDEATKVYGPYYLKEEATYNADDKTYTHTCYDAILNTMVDYEALNVTYPISIQSFYNNLVSKLGFTSNITLINGSIQLSSDPYENADFTYRTVLQDIGEANGILLYVDNKEIKEASLGTAENQALINDDILKNTNIDFGTHFGPINVIALSRSADSDVIYFPEELPTEKHEYKISDNQLMNNNNRSSFISGIYTKLYGTEFDLFDTELVGYGGFEPLQRVVFSTGGNTYTSYVFNNEITIKDSYEETIYTDEPTLSTTDYSVADTTDERIKQTYLIVDKQNQEINAVISDVEWQNEKLAKISLSIDELNTKIQDVADITTSGETSYATLDLSDVNASEPIYIRLFPINDNISYLYSNSGLYPSNSLYSKSRILRFHNKDTNEDIDYLIPDDLLYYDSDTYDDFVLDLDTQTCVINKRCEYNSSGEVVLKDTTITKNYDFPTIDLTDGDYTISLLGYSNGYISVRLMASNIYTSQYATKVEVASQITQNYDKITSEVAANYTTKEGANSLSSRITQNAASITSEVTRAKNQEETLGSRITQTESYISSEVTNRTNADSQLSSRITQNANGITSEVTSRTNADSQLSSRISQTAKSISLSVGTSSGKSTGISITTTKEDGTTSTSSGTITLSGDVIVKSNLTDGSTTISGNNITTGTLDASSVTVKNINASNIKTGTINGIAITDSTLTSNNTTGGKMVISKSGDAPIMGYRDTSPRWSIASFTAGGRFQTFDGNGNIAAYLSQNGASKTISDKNDKEDINNINENTSINLITKLRPVTFKYKEYLDDGNYHRGLLAQEVQKELNNIGIENQVYEVNEDGRYSLGYIELIPDLINCIKYQQKEIEELKENIKTLKEGK